ncbi:MAG: AbrB/MazE/SpoVT family DNA-binding domain-containing protein [Alphaproteobacteria bacterium]|nr:AbrB/MazE/SpoVT family DNA-binding domain-containing protein [Alphaproteobacteria bacterium]MBM3952245.1 AbrB/MazE/SpoVT family DNA-binding domain-containing protein [Rhodospirillales bacterium]
MAWAQIGPDGRVVIPAPFRQQLGLGDDARVLMLMEDGELRLVGRDAAIARAQALVAKYVPEGVSLVDELLADRRREAARENRRG